MDCGTGIINKLDHIPKFVYLVIERFPIKIVRNEI